MQKKVIASLKKKATSDWFEQHAKNIPIPFISAVTLRDAGFKAAITHFELFPKGLNTLHKSDLSKAPRLIKKYFGRFYSELGKIKRILVLISTEHTNPFAYDHINCLVKLLKKSKFQVKLGTLEHIDHPKKVRTFKKKSLEILPTRISSNRLVCEKFDPDFIYVADRFPMEVLNPILNIAQPVTPHRRALMNPKRKVSDHFHIYNMLISDFCKQIGLDPWLFTSLYNLESHVNFDEKSGVDKVIRATEELLIDLYDKHQKYQIEERPKIQIKNNSGTYGMGILTIHSPRALKKLFLAKKKKRTSAKTQTVINDVIIQETLPLRPLFKGLKGEVVIYLIGTEVLGGYIQTYTEQTGRGLLQSRTQLFQPITFGKSGTQLKYKSKKDPHLGLLYNNLSKIGGLAIGYDIDQKI